MQNGDLDYAVFLSSAFDPREYAQSLLNGTASSSKNAINLDARSIQALHELRLPTTVAIPSNNATGSASDPARQTQNDPGSKDILSSSTTAVASSHDAFTSAFAKAGSGDVSAALSKLSFAVDDLNKQLRGEINTHHAALLVQAGSVSSLEDNLRQIRGGLEEVESSVDRLRNKIASPYITLSTSLEKLAKLQRASDLARRASRFVTLARRLDIQTSELNAANGKGTRSGTATPTGITVRDSEGGERALSEAALTLAELDTLLEEPSSTDSLGSQPASIRGIQVIEQHIPSVKHTRAGVIQEMEMMIRRGLQDLNQSLLASSLQTAYTLAVLPKLVASLVQDLIEAIEFRIKNAFDINALARDAMSRAGEAPPSNNVSSSVFYKSRARTEPTNANLPHFQAALWARLDGLIEDMAGCCIKVHVLERVLKLKRDSSNQKTFLDEALTVLDHKPTFTFWTTLSQTFETNAREAARSSAFIQQTLSTSYPRLLRLFHEFFSKIALQSDTVYSSQYQSPETLLSLRSISGFESLYLSRCTNRMNENIASAFSGGARSPPGAQDGLTVARVLSNELDAARFDPLLVKNVAKSVGKAIDMFVDRAETTIVSDYTATLMVGPLATAGQQVNTELINALYQLWSPLSKVILSYPQPVQDILSANIASVRQAFLNVTTPLFSAMRRELASIIARIHKTGFLKPNDPTGTSVYMQDLADKISYIRRQLLSGIRVGEVMREWVTDLCKFVIRRFVSHASFVQPLGEGGKLKLTTDCTSLEFALSQLLSDYKLNLAALGEDFKALRAFRPLLFLENAHLSHADKTKDVPTQVLLHHILVRTNTLPLPHQVHKWQEVEYCKFITEHTPLENMRLIEALLKDWQNKKVKDDHENSEEVQELVKTAVEVIEREKKALRIELEKQ